MSSTLWELKEYRLEERDDDEGLVYSLRDITLHSSKGDANQYVSNRIMREGMPDTFSPLPGVTMPGSAWTLDEVPIVEIQIRAGQDLSGDSHRPLAFSEPSDPSSPLMPDDEDEEDPD